MKLVINGEEQRVDDGLTVAGLIGQMGMKADRVAVELNREIVPRDRWPSTGLQENDRLEIVHFVGGGAGYSGPCGHPGRNIRLGVDRAN